MKAGFALICALQRPNVIPSQVFVHPLRRSHTATLPTAMPSLI
jgi:hypothetical protein